MIHCAFCNAGPFYDEDDLSEHQDECEEAEKAVRDSWKDLPSIMDQIKSFFRYITRGVG